MNTVKIEFSKRKASLELPLMPGYVKKLSLGYVSPSLSSEKMTIHLERGKESSGSPVTGERRIHVTSISPGDMVPEQEEERTDSEVMLFFKVEDWSTLNIEIYISGKIQRNIRIDLLPYIRKLRYRYLLSNLDIMLLGLFIVIFLVTAITGIVNFRKDGRTINQATNQNTTRTSSKEATPTIPTASTAPSTSANPPIPTIPVTPEANPKTSSGENQPPAVKAIPKETRFTVYFLPDSPLLTRQAEEKLNKIALTLKNLPPGNTKDYTVQIYGHCALYGTERGRISLSRKRAINVFRYLKEQGWEPSSRVKVAGLGGTKPVTRDPKKQYLNRRVEIILKK